MDQYMVWFCILASIFAVAALIYVIASIIRELRKRSHGDTRKPARRSGCCPVACNSGRSSDRLALLLGAFGVTSVLVMGYSLAKQRSYFDGQCKKK